MGKGQRERRGEGTARAELPWCLAAGSAGSWRHRSGSASLGQQRDVEEQEEALVGPGRGSLRTLGAVGCSQNCW